MSDPAGKHPNLTHAGRANVHQIFGSTKFATDIDYESLYPGALLATRLINSPQGLQLDYCFYFGKTIPAATPSDFSYEDGPSHLPWQYACGKAIGELTSADIRDVEKQRTLLADRITFEVRDISGYGECEHHLESATIKPHSIVGISREVYNDAVTKNKTSEQSARINLLVACILIHEVAHAAHFRLFGSVQEDYREHSRIAEAGFEAVARIFGYTPHIRDPINQSRVGWETWQYRGIGTGSHYYDLTKIGRKIWQLPAKKTVFGMRPEFVLKLSDEDFWTGEYVRLGAHALIPDMVPVACRPEHHNTRFYKAIPLSIRDLFRTEGPSYAKKKYACFANPERQLRTRPDVDCRFRAMAFAE